MNVKKKRKHVLTFFQSNFKKFKFYYKIRNFNDLYVNIKNIYVLRKDAYTLVSLNTKYLYIPPILACVKLMKHFLKQFLLHENTVLSILIFPDFQLTSKPREVRMGKGKGGISSKVVLLRKNSNLFTLYPINKFYAYYIFKQSSVRLGVKTKINFKYW